MYGEDLCHRSYIYHIAHMKAREVASSIKWNDETRKLQQHIDYFLEDPSSVIKKLHNDFDELATFNLSYK